MNKTKKLCIIVLCVFIIYIIFMFFDISVQEGMSSDEYITQLTEQVEKSAYEKLSNHPNVNKEEALKLVREVAEAVFRSKENGYGGRAEAQSPTDRGVSREIREISIIIAMSTASIVADKALDEYIETAEYEDSKVYANDISTGIWEEEIIKQENKIKTEKQRIIQGESIPIDLTDIDTSTFTQEYINALNEFKADYDKVAKLELYHKCKIYDNSDTVEELKDMMDHCKLEQNLKMLDIKLLLNLTGKQDGIFQDRSIERPDIESLSTATKSLKDAIADYIDNGKYDLISTILMKLCIDFGMLPSDTFPPDNSNIKEDIEVLKQIILKSTINQCKDFVTQTIENKEDVTSTQSETCMVQLQSMLNSSTPISEQSTSEPSSLGQVNKTFKCLADNGTNIGEPLCCGQKGVVQNTKYICPAEYPNCFGYICGEKWGQCTKNTN